MREILLCSVGQSQVISRVDATQTGCILDVCRKNQCIGKTMDAFDYLIGCIRVAVRAPDPHLVTLPQALNKHRFECCSATRRIHKFDLREPPFRQLDISTRWHGQLT